MMMTSPGISDGVTENFAGTFDIIGANVTPSYRKWTITDGTTIDNANDFVTKMYPTRDVDIYFDSGRNKDGVDNGTLFGKKSWQEGSGVKLPFGYEKDEVEVSVLGGLIVLMMTLTSAGNVIVCVVTAPKVWSGSANPLNVLVFSLAIADILKVLVDMLPKAVEFFAMQWTMGLAICKVSSMLRTTFSNISMGTLALISFERFRSIDKPSGAAFSTKSLSVAMLTLWLWNMVSSAPLAVWFTTFGSRQSGNTVCTITSQTFSTAAAFYTLGSRIIDFFAPLAASWVCYMGIVYKTLRSRARISASLSDQFKRRQQILSRRVTVTCFCLMVLFTTCHTPFQLALLTLMYGTAAQRAVVARGLKYVWLVSLIQCVANPFLYGMMWENFRKSVRKFLRPCQRCQNSVSPASRNALKVTPCSVRGASFNIQHPKPRTTTTTAQSSYSMQDRRTSGSGEICRDSPQQLTSPATAGRPETRHTVVKSVEIHRNN